jgi:hypothetical protein
MIATSGSGHSALVIWSCVAFRTNPAYTSSTQGGRAHSSSSRLQGQGHIGYHILRVRMSRTPETFRTCASSTHKKMPGDSCIPGGLEDLFSSNQFGGHVPQVSGCTFLHRCTVAEVMCKHLYKSTSRHECCGGYGHVHIYLTSFFDGTLGFVQLLHILISAATLDGRT